MKAGFRKSLFGFNSDDVIEYIEKTHKVFSEKETLLNEKIDELKDELNSAKLQISDIIAEKTKIENDLKEYTEKYDEIERLSQNIGKLYLVSEANANAVIENAKQSREISEEAVSKSIKCADDTYSSLASLKDEIVKTSSEYLEKINSLMLSLESMKNNIYNNNLSAEKSIEEYEELLNSIKNKIWHIKLTQKI